MEHHAHESERSVYDIETCNHVPVYDLVRGEYVCNLCGLVMESGVIDYRPEPVTVCYDNVRKSANSSPKIKHMEYLLDLYSRRGHDFEIDQIVSETLRKLKRTYPDFEIDTKYYYGMCEDKLFWKNKTRDSRVGSIALVISIFHRVPLEPSEVCRVCESSDDLIRKNCQEMIGLLKEDRRFDLVLETSGITENKWIFPDSKEDEEIKKIDEFCDKTGVDATIHSEAVRLLKKVASSLNPSNHRGVGAACMRIASQNNGGNCSLCAISSFFNNDRNTIRTRMKEIYKLGY